MLALKREQEGAELLNDNEGHGSGEESGEQPPRTLSLKKSPPYWDHIKLRG